MGSVIIVDSYWDEGYSAVVLIPVTEDYNGWHGTITFSHPVLSVTVSKASPRNRYTKLKFLKSLIVCFPTTLSSELAHTCTLNQRIAIANLITLLYSAIRCNR